MYLHIITMPGVGIIFFLINTMIEGLLKINVGFIELIISYYNYY